MHKHISKHPETQHLPDDVVHYREYKILLQPDRFTSKRGFLEFWEDVGKSVKKFGLKVDIDQQGFHSLKRTVTKWIAFSRIRWIAPAGPDKSCTGGILIALSPRCG
jgi:hypothetical protein